MKLQHIGLWAGAMVFSAATGAAIVVTVHPGPDHGGVVLRPVDDSTERAEPVPSVATPGPAETTAAPSSETARSERTQAVTDDATTPSETEPAPERGTVDNEQPASQPPPPTPARPELRPNPGPEQTPAAG